MTRTRILPVARGAEKTGEKNDCTVRALANVTGKPYDEIFNDLDAAGRKSGKGARAGVWMDVYIKHGIKLEAVCGCTSGAEYMASFASKKGLTPRRTSGIVLERFMSGCDKSKRYIIQVRGHVFAVINGQVVDRGMNRTGARIISIMSL